MDSQKNDIYKSELVGEGDIMLCYNFFRYIWALSIYYFASFSNNYLLSIIIIVASKIVISKIIINSNIFDYITNDSKREK